MDLLHNNRIDNLNSNNDHIGILEKAMHIKNFFELIKEKDDLKMFCIYGEWGSGKSTLLKYLEKELQPSYNVFFFEAWEYDHTENIAYSLLEYLIRKTESASEELSGELLKIGKKLLKGLGKSMSGEISIPLLGKITIDGKQIIQDFEENKKSYYDLKTEFKTEFIRWEDSLKANNELSNYNIVFIDDLDRCDPEQTLALLSAIKLFFNYGYRTKFVYGIDKKAVQEAIKTKYHDYLKANEYLEKIFDITFTMPKINDLTKLIEANFKYDNVDTERELQDFLKIFFESINFTNPRKLKKVINKYKFLCSIKESQTSDFPNIFIKNQEHIFNTFETIYILYLIVLHEFFNDAFVNVIDIKRKIRNIGGEISIYYKSLMTDNYANVPLQHLFKIEYKQVSGAFGNNKKDVFDEAKMLVCITPFYIQEPTKSVFVKFNSSLTVTKDEIELNMYNFIYNNRTTFINQFESNRSSFFKMKTIIELYL